MRLSTYPVRIVVGVRSRMGGIVRHAESIWRRMYATRSDSGVTASLMQLLLTYLKLSKYVRVILLVDIAPVGLRLLVRIIPGMYSSSRCAFSNVLCSSGS